MIISLQSLENDIHMHPRLLSELPPGQQAAIHSYVELVHASPHNLVSRRAKEELLDRHVPEGIALARCLPLGAPRLIDIGSGGGLPGVVIAITRPDLEIHLLDSTTKKTSFLSHIARELGLAVQVHTGRAEQLAKTELGGTFDLVTARAVAPLVRLLPLTVPFLAPGGCLFAVKGDRWKEELEAARSAIDRFGVAVISTPREGLAPSQTARTRPGSEEDVAGAPKVVVLQRSS